MITSTEELNDFIQEKHDTLNLVQDKEDRALQLERENYAKIVEEAILNIYEKLSFDVISIRLKQKH